MASAAAFDLRTLPSRLKAVMASGQASIRLASMALVCCSSFCARWRLAHFDSETLVGVEQFVGAQLDTAIEVIVRGAQIVFGLAAKQIDAEHFGSADPDDRQGAPGY